MFEKQMKRGKNQEAYEKEKLENKDFYNENNKNLKKIENLNYHLFRVGRGETQNNSAGLSAFSAEKGETGKSWTYRPRRLSSPPRQRVLLLSTPSPVHSHLYPVNSQAGNKFNAVILFLILLIRESEFHFH